MVQTLSGDLSSPAPLLRSQMVGVNALLADVYDDKAMRISTLLSEIGFHADQIETLRSDHLEHILDGFVALVRGRLNKREYVVLSRRYGLDGYAPETLERVGWRLDVSRERVRQIHKKALSRCRHRATKEFWKTGVHDCAVQVVGQPGGPPDETLTLEGTRIGASIVDQQHANHEPKIPDPAAIERAIVSILQAVGHGLNCGVLAHILAGSRGVLIVDVVARHNLREHGAFAPRTHEALNATVVDCCASSERVSLSGNSIVELRTASASLETVPVPQPVCEQPSSPSDDLHTRALAMLQQALDDPAATFRDGQWEAIANLVERRARLLVVQRTGWGKSLVYFVTTRLLRDRGAGPTLLISPLLALMRNQLLAAERLDIRAATINSSNTDEWKEVQERLRADEIDILLISPERLANDDFREHVLLPAAARVAFFVVDEAHCISDWGHDFRPDYRRLARVLQALPRTIPVLATTATASNRVVTDVIEQLGIELTPVRGPLARKSLRLQNVELPGQAERLAWLAEAMPRLLGSGIIYTLTVRDAQRVAEWLQSRDINAHAYWGALENERRRDLEVRLLHNQIKAVVATSALGMGFDKPDLGFVVHFQRPGSVVHYYQQVGRAGRALDEAYGVLLGGLEDEEIVEYFIRTAFPPEAQVEEVLAALAAAEDGLSIPLLQREVNLSWSQIEKVLKSLAVLSPAPVGKTGSHWHMNPVRYEPDRAKIDALIALRRREQARMQEYMQSRECLMLFLTRELDDPDARPCGRCAVCSGRPLLPENYSRASYAAAERFLRFSDQFVEPRAVWPEDALVAHGWTGLIDPQLRAEQGRALCMWGDDGWGPLVRDGKWERGRFDDRLVPAATEMVRERWRPTPAPEWVTCVPSLAHPELVPDFARRLARSLGLPFVSSVHKTRPTEPQKRMENSYRQAHNLEQAFSVELWEGIGRPVLLVDDMVDSRWTFAVVAAHLRSAGSGPVFPVALAVTAKN